MKKTIFGKAAMILLIGTVALASCSEDFVFGYDEEWDDMIPRTIMPRTKGDTTNTNPDFESYSWSDKECGAVVLAKTCYEGTNILFWQWRTIAIALAGSEANYRSCYKNGFTALQILAASQQLGVNFTSVAQDPDKSEIYTVLGIPQDKIGVKGKYSVNPNIAQIGDHFVIITEYRVTNNGDEKIKYAEYNGENYTVTISLRDNTFYAIIY